MVKRTHKSRLHDSVFQREVMMRAAAITLPSFCGRSTLSSSCPTTTCCVWSPSSVTTNTTACAQPPRRALTPRSFSAAECWNMRQVATCCRGSCQKAASEAEKTPSTTTLFCSKSMTECFARASRVSSRFASTFLPSAHSTCHPSRHVMCSNTRMQPQHYELLSFILSQQHTHATATLRITFIHTLAGTCTSYWTACSFYTTATLCIGTSSSKIL